jgi:peptide/nickel transport system ATP-binding protein
MLTPMMLPMAILEASGIRVALPDRSRNSVFGSTPLLEILKGVDLSIAAGEALGLVGESGSGKSTLAQALLRFVDPVAGKISFEGRDITHLPQRELRPLRSRMQIVFQDSKSSLNPRLTVGSIVAEPLLSFRRAKPRQAREIAMSLIERTGLPPAVAERYPHQLSGGQRQRVGLARAMSVSPSLLVADEIVSGLDVSVQAQILDLLKTLQRETGMALVLISHDLSVVRTVCDKVVVMSAGQVVETGACAEVFAAPRHPYTRKLLRSIPLPDVDPHWLDQIDLSDAEVEEAPPPIMASPAILGEPI